MMKRTRTILTIGIGLSVTVLAVRWAMGPKGFASPGECVEAYRDAILASDADRFLDCLADPLRGEVDASRVDWQQVCKLLRSQIKDIKGWTQSVEPLNERSAVVNVDEVRAGGTRRVRYRLEQTNRGWLIAEIGQAKDVPTAVPYGTHLSKVVEKEEK